MNRKEMIKKAERFIEFKLLEKRARTEIWKVVTRREKYELGTIRWYHNWRHYCFFPNPETAFSDECMIAIGFFINKLNDAYKKKEERMK